MYKYNQKEKSLTVDWHNMQTVKGKSKYKTSFQYTFYDNGCFQQIQKNYIYGDYGIILCPFQFLSKFILKINKKLIKECDNVDCDTSNDCQYGLVCSDEYKEILEYSGYDPS